MTGKVRASAKNTSSYHATTSCSGCDRVFTEGGLVRHLSWHPEHGPRYDAIRKLAEDAGIDTWRCEFCGLVVKRHQRYIVGMDGMRAHSRCVTAYRRRERAADRRDMAAAIK